MSNSPLYWSFQVSATDTRCFLVGVHPCASCGSSLDRHAVLFVDYNQQYGIRDFVLCPACWGSPKRRSLLGKGVVPTAWAQQRVHLIVVEGVSQETFSLIKKIGCDVK